MNYTVYMRIIITILLAIIAMSGFGQDRLTGVDSADVAWRQKFRHTRFFDKEKSRLLIPEYAEFGVECIPSFSPEWALTYDSAAHTLVYIEAQESIWQTTYRSVYKLKKVSRDRSKWVARKYPRNYVSPKVVVYSLNVSDEDIAMLRAVWSDYVFNAEETSGSAMLDGTKWEYFIDGKRAKTHRENNVFVQFTNKLKEAIRNNDTSCCDSLVYDKTDLTTKRR